MEITEIGFICDSSAISSILDKMPASYRGCSRESEEKRILLGIAASIAKINGGIKRYNKAIVLSKKKEEEQK